MFFFSFTKVLTLSSAFDPLGYYAMLDVPASSHVSIDTIQVVLGKLLFCLDLDMTVRLNPSAPSDAKHLS